MDTRARTSPADKTMGEFMAEWSVKGGGMVGRSWHLECAFEGYHLLCSFLSLYFLSTNELSPSLTTYHLPMVFCLNTGS